MKTQAKGTHLSKQLLLLSLGVMAWGAVGVTPSIAMETATGDLTLQRTKIKTVQAPGEVIMLPTCSTQVAAFSPTSIACNSVGTCTIDVTVTSELSDVTPGFDSVRFYLTIDGTATGIHPSSNFGVLSTAKTGQLESGTAAWMKNGVTPGLHTVEVKMCVADVSPGGGATGFAGDRTLTIRAYTGN